MKEFMSYPPIMNLEQTMEFLDSKDSTTRTMIHKGIIIANKYGGKWYIPRDPLIELVLEGKLRA